MITVKKLKEELNKFSDDDLCYAYEGEVIGLIIERVSERLKNQGVVYCSEGNDEGKKTQLIE